MSTPAITEDFGGLPHDSRTVTYMGRELEVPDLNQWMQEHIEQPSDNESNNSELPRWSYEREHHTEPRWAFEHRLSFDSETGEITSARGTLPNEGVLFDPGSLIDISNVEPTWELAVSDVISDKYKEMEKRVEEQDKTIAEMKSIIENLQEIVYQRKLDKEAETLVL